MYKVRRGTLKIVPKVANKCPRNLDRLIFDRARVQRTRSSLSPSLSFVPQLGRHDITAHYWSSHGVIRQVRRESPHGAGITTSLPPQSAASESGSGLPSLLTRSAASEVLLVPELRQRILRHLDRKSLACFMRVDRKFMFDVATELYHTMDYGWVRSHMAMTTVRTLHQLLCHPPVNGKRFALISRSVNGLTAWPYG
jgi:hypothetical protein